MIALVAWVALRARRIDGLRKTANWLLAAIALQFAAGFLTVFLNFPLALAVMHNGGTALLVLLLSAMNYKIRTAQ